MLPLCRTTIRLGGTCRRCRAPTPLPMGPRLGREPRYTRNLTVPGTGCTRVRRLYLAPALPQTKELCLQLLREFAVLMCYMLVVHVQLYTLSVVKKAMLGFSSTGVSLPNGLRTCPRVNLRCMLHHVFEAEPVPGLDQS